MTKQEDFDFNNILIDEKSHENVLIYYISYRISIGPISLCIRFDNADGMIRLHDGTKYLILSWPQRNMMSFTTFTIGLDVLQD